MHFSWYLNTRQHRIKPNLGAFLGLDLMNMLHKKAIFIAVVQRAKILLTNSTATSRSECSKA